MKISEILRWAAKTAIFHVLYYAGILSVLRRIGMRNKAVILMYHRVIDVNNKPIDYLPPDMYVDSIRFRRQIKYLVKNYNIIPLTELIRMLKDNQSLPSNVCAITFDDGWHDVYENAVPILNFYNIPFTIFLTTNFIDDKPWFWEQRLKYLIFCFHSLLKMGRKVQDSYLSDLDFLLNSSELSTMDSHQAKQFSEKIIRSLDDSDVGKITLVTKNLEKRIRQMGYDLKNPFIDWTEITEMHEKCAEFGAHTLRHFDLTRCDKETICIEISDSRRIIEHRLKSNIETFAYPYGKNNKEIRDSVKRENFSGACGTNLGLVPFDSDLYLLNRINIYNDVVPTTAMFAGRILNLLNFSTNSKVGK